MRKVALRMKEMLLAFLLLKRRRVSMSQSEKIALIIYSTNFSTGFLPAKKSFIILSCFIARRVRLLVRALGGHQCNLNLK